jgi:hypothetical protein
MQLSLTIERGAALAPTLKLSSSHPNNEEAEEGDQRHQRHGAGLSDFTDEAET